MKVTATQMYSYIVIWIRSMCMEWSSLQSLDFTVNRFFMKLFRTSDILIVHECQSLFGVQQPSVTLSKRFDKFVQKYATNI